MVLLVAPQKEEEEERGKIRGGMKTAGVSSLLGQSLGGRNRL